MKPEISIRSLNNAQLADFMSKLASCYNCPAMRQDCFRTCESCRQAWMDYILRTDESRQTCIVKQKKPSRRLIFGLSLFVVGLTAISWYFIKKFGG